MTVELQRLDFLSFLLLHVPLNNSIGYGCKNANPRRYHDLRLADYTLSPRNPLWALNLPL
jgi:hypothetical protein